MLVEARRLCSLLIVVNCRYGGARIRVCHQLWAPGWDTGRGETGFALRRVAPGGAVPLGPAAGFVPSAVHRLAVAQAGSDGQRRRDPRPGGRRRVATADGRGVAGLAEVVDQPPQGGV